MLERKIVVLVLVLVLMNNDVLKLIRNIEICTLYWWCAGIWYDVIRNTVYWCGALFYHGHLLCILLIVIITITTYYYCYCYHATLIFAPCCSPKAIIHIIYVLHVHVYVVLYGI
jgi:hypothetical protein